MRKKPNLGQRTWKMQKTPQNAPNQEKFFTDTSAVKFLKQTLKKHESTSFCNSIPDFNQ